MTGLSLPDDIPPDFASPARLLALTAQIVSAQVRGNEVSAAELPRLVEAVHRDGSRSVLRHRLELDAGRISVRLLSLQHFPR